MLLYIVIFHIISSIYESRSKNVPKQHSSILLSFQNIKNPKYEPCEKVEIYLK